MPPRLQIGGWWVDRTTNEIGRAGDTVRLEPKVMEVLMVLAGRAGAVVTREEVLSTVWPGVVVGDEALTQSIIKLRKALGDKPRSPVFIETIPKRGYRLIAKVADDNAAPALQGDDGSASRPSATPDRRGVRALGVALGVVMAVTATGLYFAGPWMPLTTRTPAEADDSDAGYENPAGLPTVTVLPFESVGAGAEQGYLARGISSDLMTDLSRLSGVRVVSTSLNAGNSRAAKSARYVVAGSVQRAGAVLRINVRLTDARTNEQLWSRRYERPFDDLIAIQNEISRGLIEQLPATLSDAERRRLAKRYTRSAEAYENFLRGRALFLVRRPEANERARAFYTKALELDPQFARAYAGLAMTYAMDYRYQQSGGSSAALDRALELAETARQIDSDIPEVYWAIGFIHVQSRRHDQAIEALEKAIELSPSYADAYALLGGIYTYIGQPARSIPLLRAALRLNPDGGYLYFLLLGRAYLFEDELDQALFNLNEALRRNPEDMEAHIYLAATLVAKGNRGAAESEADEIRVAKSNFSMRDWLKTYPLTSPREIQRLLDLTAKVQL
jgi:DNA-binding winged helix-turn-helix (wHTH) protein/TolB-like protein/Tfp pilus assembly protein PilF